MIYCLQGPVRFEDGDRVGNAQIKQLQGIYFYFEMIYSVALYLCYCRSGRLRSDTNAINRSSS